MFCNSFSFFLIARSPRSVGRSPRNFAACSKACSIYKCRSKNLGVPLPPRKKIGVKNLLNLARFRTPFHFECKYLRNGWRYLKSENLVHYNVHSHVQRKKLVNFGPLSTKIWKCNYSPKIEFFGILYFGP